MTVSRAEGFNGRDFAVLRNPRPKIDPLMYLCADRIGFKCKTHVFPLFPT